MIEEIRISDLGVISEAVLPLGPGFTAITGETGAGKTMVVTALGLLRGERADSSAVRVGSEQAWVEGRWEIEPDHTVSQIVGEAGGVMEHGELLLGRSVSSEGRSRAVVGGRSTPVSVLGELGECLVAVHGQSDQVRLKSAAAQRDALDRFAGVHFSEVLSEYAHAYTRWKANARELHELVTASNERAREAKELRDALSEIEAVAPQSGEDIELAALAERLSNNEELRLTIALAREALSSEESDSPDALGLVDTAKRQAEKMAAVDPVLLEIANALTDLSVQLHDVTGQLSSHLANVEGEGEHDLDAVQQRRAEISSLMRKYGPSLEEVLAVSATGSERLSELEGDTERITELEADVAEDYELVLRGAHGLHELRLRAALALSVAVTAELEQLAMPDAQLVVNVIKGEEPALYGFDTVELLLKPHSGSEPRPVAKSASGGELSRIMLALEVVIASKDSVPTYVFDEVDAGVGGAAAIEIGRRLARLAQTSQVIVVTHLAQVAAFATNHLRVVKDTAGQVTSSSVQALRGSEREAEMARLLSGLPDSENALAHARELIEMASSR